MSISMIVPTPFSIAALQAATDLDELPTSSWLVAGSTLVGGVIAAAVINRLVVRLITGIGGERFAGVVAGRVAAYSVFVLAFIYALNVLNVRVVPLLGALGIGGILLALALQKVVESLVAGVVLHARRPFTAGDTVELDGVTGLVLDVDARTTVLRRLDGVVVRIPNIDVISNHINTLTREPIRRSEVVVGVAYDTDLDEAHRVIVDAVSHLDRVRTDPAPTALLAGFNTSTIDFNVYVWHGSDVPSELAARHDVVLAIHRALAAADITIAFPQVVVWTPGERAPASYTDSEPHVRSTLPLREGVRPKRGPERSRSLRFRRSER